MDTNKTLNHYYKKQGENMKETRIVIKYKPEDENIDWYTVLKDTIESRTKYGSFIRLPKNNGGLFVTEDNSTMILLDNDYLIYNGLLDHPDLSSPFFSLSAVGVTCKLLMDIIYNGARAEAEYDIEEFVIHDVESLPCVIAGVALNDTLINKIYDVECPEIGWYNFIVTNQVLSFSDPVCNNFTTAIKKKNLIRLGQSDLMVGTNNNQGIWLFYGDLIIYNGHQLEFENTVVTELDTTRIFSINERADKSLFFITKTEEDIHTFPVTEL